MFWVSQRNTVGVVSMLNTVGSVVSMLNTVGIRVTVMEHCGCFG